MALKKTILNNKIKVLDEQIKQLKYKLNAKEWERKKYIQFSNNISSNISPESSTKVETI